MLETLRRVQLACFTTAVLTFHGGVARGQRWQISTVESQGNLMAPSLALDASGRPHIAYSDFTRHVIRYTVQNGATWTIEDVDPLARPFYPSLALDANGRPHIAYRASGSVKYAVKTGASWSIETVETPQFAYGEYGSVGLDVDIAIDAVGTPHLAYFNSRVHYPSFAVTGEIRFATRTAQSQWQVSTVSATGGYSGRTSLAIDASGVPHVLFYDNPNTNYTFTNTSLKYAVLQGGTWRIERLDPAGYKGAIIADNVNRPHVLFFSGFSAKYAVKSGSTWAIETVESGQKGLNGASIALDQNRDAHVSYSFNLYGPYLSTEFRYAVRRGGTWTTEPVDCREYPAVTSIALDSNGEPHISYEKRYADDIRYASRRAGPAPDSDGDGLADNVDENPGTFSSAFNDRESPLDLAADYTRGQISDRGDQTVTVTDEICPRGVTLRVATSAGPRPATVRVCGSLAELTLSAGANVELKCSSVTLAVRSGVVRTSFAVDGVSAVASLEAGNEMTFDKSDWAVHASATNRGVITLSLGGTYHVVHPGQALALRGILKTGGRVL